jgi:hypothetical protein
MATPKQEKLIQLLLENLGKEGSRKSLGEMMRESGYSEAQSKNPYQIMESNGVQEGIAEFVSELKAKRDKALKSITEDKLADASARDNAHIVDILTKNIQLLSGQDTERSSVVIKEVKDMTPSEVDEYLKNKLNAGSKG